MTSAYGWLVLSSEATRLASEATREVYTQIWELVSHGLAYHKPFYTMHPRVGAGEIRASTPRAMPILQIKSKPRQTVLICFPCLEIGDGRHRRVKSCFQVWLCGVCHNFSLGRDGTLETQERSLVWLLFSAFGCLLFDSKWGSVNPQTVQNKLQMKNTKRR